MINEENQQARKALQRYIIRLPPSYHTIQSNHSGNGSQSTLTFIASQRNKVVTSNVTGVARI